MNQKQLDLDYRTSCFRDALKEMGIQIPDGLEVPNSIKKGDIPAVCKKLGLQWYGEGDIEIEPGPMIILYTTITGKGHAIFTCDPRPFLDKDIIGLILPGGHCV